MSTKATVFDNYLIDIYEETSESKTIFGKFVGFNVYMYIVRSELSGFDIDNEYINIRTTIDGFNEMSFWLGNVNSIDLDSEHFGMVFKGGRMTEKIISNFKETGVFTQEP